MKALSGKHAFKKSFLLIIATFIFFMITTICLAAIPLVTEDAGTQGKGNFQLEILGIYSKNKECKDEKIPCNESQQAGVEGVITYGITDTVDIELSVPYLFLRFNEGETIEKTDGLSDAAIEMKWRFFEKDSLSFAIKPGISLPVGNEDKGLGSGRTAYYLHLIISKEWGPWSFYSDLAYMRNENKNDESNNIWHASLAVTCEIIKSLKIVGDFGVKTYEDKSSIVPPAYILGGVIFSPVESFDIGLGVKTGLNKSETDISVRGGITCRF